MTNVCDRIKLLHKCEDLLTQARSLAREAELMPRWKWLVRLSLRVQIEATRRRVDRMIRRVDAMRAAAADCDTKPD